MATQFAFAGVSSLLPTMTDGHQHIDKNEERTISMRNPESIDI